MNDMFLRLLLSILFFVTVPAEASTEQLPRASIVSQSCSNSDEFYPRQSRQLNETGVVELAFIVEADGKLSSVTIKRSSGYRRLDQATRKVLETCKIKPATNGADPVRSVGFYTVHWIIDSTATPKNHNPWAVNRTAGEYFERGNTLLRNGDNDKAIEEYNEALRIDPQHADSFLSRGVAWRRKGDLDRAIADYNQALLISPKKALAFGNRGLVWAIKGDLDKAIEDYSQAIRIDPQYAGAYRNRGDAWARKGDLDKAIEDYSQAIRIDAQDGNAYGNRGSAWVRKGDLDKAIEDYNQVLRIDPQNTQAKAKLDAVQRLKGTNHGQQAPPQGRELATQVRNGPEAGAELRRRDERQQIPAAEVKAERKNLDATCPPHVQKHNCLGVHFFSNGEKYVGEFLHDRQHGLGILYRSDGASRLIGRWEDGRFIERISLDISSFAPSLGTALAITSEHQPHPFQSTLSPCPESGLKHNCFGKITFPSGSKYVGEFRNDKFNGQGMFTLHGGDIYVGEFRDYKYNGEGTLTLIDGSRYVGEFRESYRHGQGVEYRADGSVSRSGQWTEGNLAQSYALDTNRFPFNPPQVAAIPPVDPGKTERDRLAAEVEAERKKRQELEAQLAEAKEREQRIPTPPTQVASPRNPHALIIGNAAYPGSARLDNPINDANAVAQKLKTMGFTVTVVTDANRQRLVQAMSNFRKTASNADLSLLFYSGHGVQIFGTNYILPTDADQSDVAQATIQGVSLNSVVENFLPGKTKIVFLDACRDNPLQRTGDRTVSKGLAPISVAQGTLIAYATKDGQTASDGVGQKNSPFTKALLEHLSDPQDIAVILRKVREKVMTATGGKQQPWEYGSLTGGELVLSGVRR